MVVDIKIKKTPGYNVAYLTRTGSEGTDPLRREFNELTAWAKKQKLRTGKWIFAFYEGGRAPSRYKFEACLEVPARAKSDGKIKVKKLDPITVASVKFNPDHVSPRLVYNGVYGWLKENKDYKESDSYSREIYFGNPWTDSWVWARTEIQVPGKKKGR